MKFGLQWAQSGRNAAPLLGRTIGMPSELQTAFFSYCRSDSEFALKLAEDLRSAGAHVWIDQRDIEPGAEWDYALEDALTTSACVLVILSSHSVGSRNVRNELSFALDAGKRVIPILYRDCKVPMALTRLQLIDFRTDYAWAIEKLVRCLGVSQQSKVDAATSTKIKEESSHQQSKPAATFTKVETESQKRSFAVVSPDLISREWLATRIQKLAFQIGRLRKADLLIDPAMLDRLIPSTQAEMEDDWRKAILQLTLEAMNRNLRLHDLDAQCFPYFESVWLQELSEYMAYSKRREHREVSGEVMHSAEQERVRYNKALDTLRDYLEDPTRKERPGRFLTIKQYVESKCDGPGFADLVLRKQERLIAVVQHFEASTMARQYTAGFYGNIVKAVDGRDKLATLNVLRSLSNGASRDGFPGIISCFEGILAVSYLDPKLVREAWDNPESGVSRGTTF